MITYDKLYLEISFDELRHGVKVNVTVQVNSKKLIKFCACSDPSSWFDRDFQWWQPFAMALAGNKA